MSTRAAAASVKQSIVVEAPIARAFKAMIASRMQGGVPVEGQGLRSSLMPYLGGRR
jgi:hypothetical protein